MNTAFGLTSADSGRSRDSGFRTAIFSTNLRLSIRLLRNSGDYAVVGAICSIVRFKYKKLSHMLQMSRVIFKARSVPRLACFLKDLLFLCGSFAH